MPTKVTTSHYKHFHLILQHTVIMTITPTKFLLVLTDRFMTEGGPSLILCTLKNSDQMLNNYLLKASNKDSNTIWATCSKSTVMSLEQY